MSGTLPAFEELYQAADARQEQVPLVAIGATDETVLAAMRQARDRGWARPILAGDATEIRQTAERAGISLHGLELLDSREPSRDAVAAVKEGKARLLLKGQIATPTLMRALLDPLAGLRTDRVIGQVVLLELPRDQRVLLLADTGVCIKPTLKQKADLLRHCVEVARTLGLACPRVALLAATESVNEAMPETLDAAELQRQAGAGQFGECQVQGPLSFDLAYAPQAGDRKKLAGPVIGAADVLLFPDLLSANLTIKAIMYTASCRFGGILLGTACPVVFMSRADDVPTRLNSLAYALAAGRPA